MSPTDRREFLKLALTATGAAVLGDACRSDRPPPNVLFVSIDDLNNWPACIGGHPDAVTPNIDRLAARGTLFRRAYSDGVNCPATRGTVMSGLSPQTTTITHFDKPFRSALPDAVTLPEYFVEHGYRSLAVGKLFHENDVEYFQEYHLPSQVDLTPHRVDPDAWGGIKRGQDNWGPLLIPDREMFDFKVAKWGIQQLEAEHDRPFFLGVGFLRPHLPWLVPRKYFRPFPWRRVALPEVMKGDARDVPEYARNRMQRAESFVNNETEYRQAVAAYLASIHFADAQLGRLLDALDASAYRDNTVVVLWSDHGFLLGEKGGWHKYTLWEQATQVPLVVAMPGVADRGTVCERPVTLVHLYPTLLDLCGLPAKEGLEGKSLRPLLRRPDAPWDPAVTTMDLGSFAVRGDRYSYTRYLDGSEELYDREEDPHEWHNLAALEEYAEVKAELARWLPGATG